MKRTIRTALLAAVTAAATGGAAAHPGSPEWIRNAVFYDIYPSSFQDSDGDGIGDLKGIISRLDYVKSLGVDAIWMNPIYRSGWFDGGYDIIDYYSVDPRFGTAADVRRLVEEAHARGLKVCLDLVPGHTSNKADWFVRAVTEGPDGRYAGYYIFADEISPKDSADIAKRYLLGDPDSSKLGPWVPVDEARVEGEDGGEVRGGFYQRNYYPCQPALNFGFADPDPSKPWQQGVDAPGPKAVRREMKNIMAYWFDMGVDGFRVDMAESLVKGDRDGRATRELWSDMRRWLDREYPGKVLISEWGRPGIALPGGFDMDFPLIHKSPGYKQLTRGTARAKAVGEDAYFERHGKGGIDKFVKEFDKAFAESAGYGYVSFFSSNHDINRANSEGRDTPDQIKVLMTFLMTMPGVPFIHYGDEIMMRNVKGLPSVEGSREERSGTRTPMQWDNSPAAGFSTAAPERLYLPVFTDGGRLTVEAQEADPQSVLNHVRRLIGLRHDHPGLANASDWRTLSPVDKPYPWVYARTTPGGTVYIVALNPGEKAVRTTVSLPQAAAAAPGATMLDTVGRARASVKDGRLTVDLGGISAAVMVMK